MPCPRFCLLNAITLPLQQVYNGKLQAQHFYKKSEFHTDQYPFAFFPHKYNADAIDTDLDGRVSAAGRVAGNRDTLPACLPVVRLSISLSPPPSPARALSHMHVHTSTVPWSLVLPTRISSPTSCSARSRIFLASVVTFPFSTNSRSRKCARAPMLTLPFV